MLPVSVRPSTLQTLAMAAGQELDAVPAHTRGERLATWAGVRVDRLVRRALRGLYLGRGVPFMSAVELERSLGMLRCYTDPDVLREPDTLFAPPRKLPPLRIHTRKAIRGGARLHWTFESPYRPVHPLYGSEFRRYDRLDTAHLFGWRHARPSPVSIILVHGWGLGAVHLHAREFGVDFLFRRLGLDVYYYVHPFHWVRKPSRARFSGELHPSPNLMRTNEAFIQTVQELRTIIGHLQAHGDTSIGMMGSSLGGYTTALLASVDDRLDFAIPIMTPASLADLFWEQGKGDPVRAQVESMGMTRERFRWAWSLHSPLSHRPRVPPSGRMFVSATGDALVTPEHVDPLWHHWDRPRHHRFAGGHILQVYGRRYQHEVARFLHGLGLVPTIRLALAGVPTP